MEEQPPGKSAVNGSAPNIATGVAPREIEQSIKDLFSDDYETRAETVSTLGKHGEKAAELLVSTLLKRSHVSTMHMPITTALEVIGKNSINVLINALGRIKEIDSARDVYLVEALAETLWHICDRKAAGVLVEQVRKLESAVKTRKSGDQTFVELCTAAKTRIHLILSEMGIKEGVDDLLAMLGDGRKRVREGVVEALEKVGDKRALVPLARLYGIERNVSDLNARQIKNSAREIVRREAVSPADALFHDLGDQEKMVMEKFFPKARSNGNGHH
ncbi:MAG: hypothetical protein A2Z34_11635 [Planctomycetes bacterium RBG_16_59_8]|nr:MAG: hypothetical protein A2Z34_11635 [Planctomycetes bacterium RBG_16_59_8]